MHEIEVKRIRDSHKFDLHSKDEWYLKNGELVKSAHETQTAELRNLIENLKDEACTKELNFATVLRNTTLEAETTSENIKILINERNLSRIQVEDLSKELEKLKYKPKILMLNAEIQTEPEPRQENDVMKRQRVVITKCQNKIEYLEDTISKLNLTMQANYDRMREKISILNAQLKQKDVDLFEIQVLKKELQKELQNRDEKNKKTEEDLIKCKRQLRSSENDLNFLFSSTTTSESSQGRRTSIGNIKPQTPKSAKRQSFSRNSNRLTLNIKQIY